MDCKLIGGRILTLLYEIRSAQHSIVWIIIAMSPD